MNDVERMGKGKESARVNQHGEGGCREVEVHGREGAKGLLSAVHGGAV